jgi:hypothetical protein
VRANTRESVPALFVAVTVNDEGPAARGVPETVPVDESKLNPAGRAPDDTAKVMGAVPDASIVAEYRVPTTARGSVADVVMDGGTAAAAMVTV